MPNLLSPFAGDLTTARLLEDVSAGIRVLRARDGISLSDDQIVERARNIVMAIIGNYRIESLDDEEALTERGRGDDAGDARAD